jgi:hypothetical protein
MKNNDVIEFYYEDALIARVHSSMPPLVDELISIQKKTWRIARRTFALDYSGGLTVDKSMRCNIDLAPINGLTKN